MKPLILPVALLVGMGVIVGGVVVSAWDHRPVESTPRKKSLEEIFGKAPDYAALAKEAGAISSTPAPRPITSQDLDEIKGYLQRIAEASEGCPALKGEKKGK